MDIKLKQTTQAVLLAITNQKVQLEHQYRVLQDGIIEILNPYVPKELSDNYELANDAKNGEFYLKYIGVEPAKTDNSTDTNKNKDSVSDTVDNVVKLPNT